MWNLEIIQKKEGIHGSAYEVSVVLAGVCLEQACTIMEAFAVRSNETRFAITKVKEKEENAED